MSDFSMEEQLTQFKMILLRRMPFYGDLLTNIPIIADTTVPTACTDGRTIRFNPGFMKTHTKGERHFIIMHEVMHMLMLHCVRGRGKDPRLYNTAADIVVNAELTRLKGSMVQSGIEFEIPKDGIFHSEYSYSTVENVYEKLLSVNREKKGAKEKRKILIPKGYGRNAHNINVDSPADLLIAVPGEGGYPSDEVSGGGNFAGMPDPERSAEAIEKHITELLRHAEETRQKGRSPYGSYYIPGALYTLVESKYLPWKRLLRDFLMEETSDDVSYATPERKYLHMDLILPGHGEKEETLENVWAFVDTSGSIAQSDMGEFLTQLYRIAKEFHCRMNIVYWDTKVSDVYKNIRGEENILKSVSHSSGGTDINCVYRWIADNHLKPEVMLILTDGYYGTLQEANRIPSLRKKTILVITKNGAVINDDMKKLGKVTKL